MAERYPERWEQLRGSTWDGKMWAEDLHALTPEQFAQGVRLDLERGKAFPPSSPEFVAMATKLIHSGHPSHQPLPALPETVSTPGVAERWQAYQQLYGLRHHDMTQEQIQQTLDGVDIDAMHQQVRDGRRRAGFDRWEDWPPPPGMSTAGARRVDRAAIQQQAAEARIPAIRQLDIPAVLDDYSDALAAQIAAGMDPELAAGVALERLLQQRLA